MAGHEDLIMEITPQVLLKAYACGIFPMAESASDPGLFWVEPEYRGIIPLDDFHIPKRLSRTIRQNRFDIRFDTSFNEVIEACSKEMPNRKTTWINARIKRLYGELFELGHCHSVEAWQDDKLVGGLYGVKLGAAFFGESMFSTVSDASKVALVHLVERLRKNNFMLLDTQFTTAHLKKFGAIDVPRDQYEVLLHDALKVEAEF